IERMSGRKHEPSNAVIRLTKVAGLRAGLLCLVLILAPLAVSAGEKVIDFDIPAQSVQSALVRFSEQSQILLLIPSGKFADEPANPVVGTFTAEEALAKMLEGTSIDATINAETGQLIVKNKLNSAEESSMTERIRGRNILAMAIAAIVSNGASTTATAQEDNQATQAA